MKFPTGFPAGGAAQAVLKSTTVWLGLTSLPYDKTSLSVVSGSHGRIDLFGVLQGANAIGQKSWNGTTWTDSSHPGLSNGLLFSSAPTAISGDHETLDVFVTDTDKTLYNRHWNGSAWTPAAGWTPIGSAFDGPVAAVSGARGRIDVFAKSTDSSLWNFWYDDASQSWSSTSLGGSFISSPAVVSWGPNRIDVIGVGSDRGIWHRFFGGSNWSTGWVKTGEQWTVCPPSVVSNAEGRLDAFAFGELGVLHNVFESGAWKGWSALNGFVQSFVAAVAVKGSGNIDIYATGSDTAFWHRGSSNGNDWRVDWDSHLGTFASAPALVSPSTGLVDVFGINQDKKILHARWNGTGRTWTPRYQTWQNLKGSFVAWP